MGFSSTGGIRKWPTRRMATWAASAVPGPIVDVTTLDAWLTANITDIASARVAFRELIRAMVEMGEGGETGA